FAVAAIVVEELDEGDVAVLVAEGDAARRIEDRFGIVGDGGFVLCGFGRALPLAEFGHRLFEHFGMRDQVLTDDRLDIAALLVGEVLSGGGQRRAAECERKQRWDKKTERRHWKFLMRRVRRFW